MANQFLPISISLNARRCLVIGGGRVALRKIDTLLNYDSDITVIAPEIDEKIDYYAAKNSLKVIKREYKSPEAAEYGLVISASDNMDVNRQVSDDCKKAGVPVNVVDKPSLCDFIFPAVIRRDCLTVAVSSDGKAPFLSGHIRMILENIFPENWNKVARYAAAFREKVQSRLKGDFQKKTEAYARFLEADWKEIIKEKSGDEIEQMLDDMAGA
jgi:siroheme synthase-like protein